MRKALVVGVDHYVHMSPLFGCVNDAHSVKGILERNSDGTTNFDVRLMTGTGSSDVDRSDLKDAVTELFGDEALIALFYFAGHGHIGSTGGFVCATNTNRGDEGLSLAEILTLANNSNALNKVIILDSCHSGIAGAHPVSQLVELSDGLTILTASTAEQYASEENGRGVFTSLFVDAMTGAAGNLVGDVTPGSVYAHIDQSLGSWDQRPVFKTNVKSFVSLRKVQAPVELADLQRLPEFFPAPGHELELNPSFEPEINGRPAGAEAPDPANVATFAILQKLNRVGLLVPVGAPHMWHAAMESKSCKLTVLGEHYRRLAVNNRI